MGKKSDQAGDSRSDPVEPMAISLLNQLTDAQLLHRHETGDEASFELLFQRHYHRVYGLLIRLVGSRQEAEDLAQEVFLRLYRRPLRGGREHNVGGWLYRVATRTGYNALRADLRRGRRNLVLVPPESRPEDNPAVVVEQQETAAAVRRALARLKPAQAQLLLLRQIGLSYGELAAACDMNPASVGQALARAAEAFRKIYRD